MKTKNYFIYVVIAAAVMVGCDDEMPDYYDSRSYEVGNFDAVVLGDALQVEIMQGDEFSVVARGETPDLEDLIFRVENGVLIGHYREGSRNHKRSKVLIIMPQLTGIKLSAATDTKISGFNVPPDSFFLQLSGASAALVEGNFRSLEVRIDGASELILKGEGDVMEVHLNGASRFQAKDLKLTSAEVEVGGASEAVISVSDRLEGRVQGSSLLRYVGNPQLLDVFVANDSHMSKY